ncbi:sugar phosphate isomerase/epimerase [Carboxylicivirga sp. N1Y132]|uniref:Sugar phosphate isomerase/epimerase n=1 Tax=Carboxylicivirga marina TaxID=2800988 RepID=A0ABS1HNS5_9BACT|nr:sugar phosphate isomerase/epimerase [Carboxylicivirga marina]
MRLTLILAITLYFLPHVNAKKVEKNIGIQLWSVRDDMKADAEGTIMKLGEIGYSFVEAAGYGDGKFYGMEPLAFKKLLNDNGLQFTASHCGQALPDEANWEKVMQWWDQCIDAHAEAGVQYIVQPFMDKKGYGSLEDLKRYCDYFNVIGEKCNAKGIRFGYHNHDKEFEEVDGIIRYDYMLQNTDPEKVMFQLDLYWIMVGEKDALSYFKKYPKRFELWHVKDEKELGESGKMDFEPIFKKASKSGMKEIIVEVERYNYEPLKSVEKSLEFLMNARYVK